MTGFGFGRRDVLKSAGLASLTLAGVRAGATAQTNEAAGDRIWSFETGGPVESEVTVVDETAYFGSHDGYAYALDAETGEELWRFETGEPPEGQTKTGPGVWGAPHVVDGTAYVGANDNHLYALDAATGEERWRYDAGRYVWASPTVIDGVVYGASRSHLVFALDAATGEEEWTYRAEGPVGSAPTVVDGRVHFSSYLDVNMTTLDAATGERTWYKEFSSELCAPPAYSDGTVYTAFVDRPLYAFDAETGEEEWNFAGDTFGIKSPPTVWNGTVYQAAWDTLYAVDADTGELEWFYDDAVPRRNAPTVAGGVLFVGSSRDTYLLALDAATGEERWRFEVYGNVRSSPTVVDGVVFFGADDGYVHAVDAGVEGSSEDSRFEQGVTGHHHAWVGDPEPDLSMVPDGEPYVRADEPFELPYGDWFENVPNYDGTVDRRGSGRVTVTVGAGPDGMQFDPPAMVVDPGSKIRFEWTGDGGNHNVVEENGVWESELSDEAGHAFPLDWSTLGRANLSEHGVYRYYCGPHRDLGMKGAIVVGDVDAALEDVGDDATETSTDDAETTDGSETTTGGVDDAEPTSGSAEGSETTGGGVGERDTTADDSVDETTADGTPGFGVLGGLASVGAGGYLLARRRRLDDDE